jgi:phytoene synthase
VVIPPDPTLARAYEYCARMAREHYENFPVASLLLPRSMRPHIAAIYAFARRADDFADEGGLAPEERFGLLDDWGNRLAAAAAGNPRSVVSGRELAFKDDHLVFEALAHTIHACALPASLFQDLLSAFRQDVTKTRYATWAEVLDYCRRSANPVGRLVLRVSGLNRPELDAASDAVCTALQLTNFWQDLGLDWRERNRLYVPLDEMEQAGAREADLTDGRMTREWRGVLSSLIARTRDLFTAGRTVADHVNGRLRWELRVTWLGGMRILGKTERARERSFDERPKLTALDAALMLRDALLWTR